MSILQSAARLALITTVVAIGAGCEVPESATDLHPEGPPKIQQVFMAENYTDDLGTIRRRSILAYGTHAAIAPENVHATTTAATSEQTIRVVFDEILRGNALEEVRCRLIPREYAPGQFCIVPGDGYSRVPIGATPDDIARCAVANDLLDQECGGPYAVCMSAMGVPCGVEDNIPIGGDGGPDDLRLINGQVKIMCGTIEVPLDYATSYWQPAGNQLVPSGQTAQSSLGPALVLKPINGRMPTGQTCRLVLASDVVDKDDIQVCAPADGNINTDCTPGDISAVSFGTDGLRFTSSEPNEGQTGVDPAITRIRTFWNAQLLPASINATNVTVDPAITGATVVPDGTQNIAINLNGATLTANTEYTVTFANIQDSFGSTLQTPILLHFTVAGP